MPTSIAPLTICIHHVLSASFPSQPWSLFHTFQSFLKLQSFLTCPVTYFFPHLLYSPCLSVSTCWLHYPCSLSTLDSETQLSYLGSPSKFAASLLTQLFALVSLPSLFQFLPRPWLLIQWTPSSLLPSLTLLISIPLLLPYQQASFLLRSSSCPLSNQAATLFTLPKSRHVGYSTEKTYSLFLVLVAGLQPPRATITGIDALTSGLDHA